METMLLLYPVRLTRLYTALGTVLHTDPAVHTVVCDLIPFQCNISFPPCIAFPEDGSDAQMKVLYGPVPDFKYNTDFSGISRVYIGKIRLFLKDLFHPVFLFLGTGTAFALKRIISLYLV